MNKEWWETEERDHIVQESLIMAAIYSFFESTEKAMLWYTLENPLFGHMSPKETVLRGRGHKVLTCIDNALKDGKPIDIEEKG